MLQALLVTFREGIESFLIVGRRRRLPARRPSAPGWCAACSIGLGVSVVTCLAGAWLWLQVPNQPLYEGIAALDRRGDRRRAAGPDAARRPPHERARSRRASATGRGRRGRARVAAGARRRGAGDHAAGDARGARGGLLPRRAGAGAARRRGADAGDRWCWRAPCWASCGAGFVAWGWTRCGRRLNLGVDPQGHGAVPRPVPGAAASSTASTSWPRAASSRAARRSTTPPSCSAPTAGSGTCSPTRCSARRCSTCSGRVARRRPRRRSRRRSCIAEPRIASASELRAACRTRDRTR